MAMVIAILEDNVERREAMRSCLEDRFHQYEVRFFEGAAEMLRFLNHRLQETIAISLDHDLDSKLDSSDGWIDMGCGREVADYLEGKAPVCPVVIHSTNSAAATGMEMTLQDAQWKTMRVVPFGDLEWIPTKWFRTIRRAIVGPLSKPTRGQKQTGSRS
jgi:CheY-like chemotaxis protein